MVGSRTKCIVRNYRKERALRQGFLGRQKAEISDAYRAYGDNEEAKAAVLMAKIARKSVKHFPRWNVFVYVRRNAGRRETTMIMNMPKQPPILEDLRNHSQEEMAELRTLLSIGAQQKPDPRRPGFFEVSGIEHVYYIFKYPNGSKVLLLGVWDRDPVAEMVACSCPAA
jgi:hypothetical protein